MNGDRSQVCIDVQQLSQREEPRFGAQLARGAVEPGITHRAQQHGVAAQHGRAGLGWEGIVGHGHRGRADRKRFERETQLEALTDGLEHAHGLRDHLGPDAVARQDRDCVSLHGWLRS